VLIVGLIFALRSWGITGAATAVLLATLILAVLMQGLVRRVVGLTWREMAAPMWPSVTAAAGAAAVIGAVTFTASRVIPALPDWLLLTFQVSAGGLFWLIFTLFVRFRALQDVVDEVLDDVFPLAVRRQIGRIRRRRA
jgi:hypothetical protein